jgi:hypothetical protein
MSTESHEVENVDKGTGEISREVTNPFAGAPIVAAPTGAVAAALMQREVAEVQAMAIMAKQYPRDERAAMDRILNACTRPSLADAATYQYARGGTNITGPSIRLAEELARQWGNIVCGITELARHGNTSECMAYAMDLQTNFRDEKRFQVKHWRDTQRGGYLVTEERDIYELVANYGARRKRACILTIIPGDVAEEAVKQCALTLSTEVKLTPERIKNMLTAFEEKYGVTKEQVEKLIQRHADAMTPALFVRLNNIINSMKDGMSKAADWFEMPEAEQQPATKTDAVRHKLAAKRAGQGDEK